MSQQRFRLTNAPEALPGSCYLCNTASREFFVDCGMQVEFHGAFYICSECLAEMARLAGFETPGNVLSLNAQKSALETQVFDLTKEIDGLERVVDGYASLRSNSNTTPVGDPGQLSFDSLSSESAQGRTEGLGTGTGTPIESSDEQRVGDVPTVKSSEFTLDL